MKDGGGFCVCLQPSPHNPRRRVLPADGGVLSGMFLLFIYKLGVVGRASHSVPWTIFQACPAPCSCILFPPLHDAIDFPLYLLDF